MNGPKCLTRPIYLAELTGCLDRLAVWLGKVSDDVPFQCEIISINSMPCRICSGQYGIAKKMFGEKCLNFFSLTGPQGVIHGNFSPRSGGVTRLFENLPYIYIYMYIYLKATPLPPAPFSFIGGRLVGGEVC